MQKTNWKYFAELVGIAAIVASLIFVGAELRQSRAIAIGEGNLANAEIQIESNNAISEHSAVWIRGNSGEELGESDTLILDNLVRNKAIHAFMEYARLDQLEFDVAADEINVVFSVFLFENPGARESWNRSEAFLSEHFSVSSTHRRWRERIHANLSGLDEATAD
jgi:hypothetical protein